MSTTQTMHTPGPWRVMPCPQHHGKHPFHDHRWIATADAEVERGHDPRPDQWSLSAGTLIAQMRDGEPANAHLIAAAPDLLAACQLSLRNVRSLIYQLPVNADQTQRQSLITWASKLETAIADSQP